MQENRPIATRRGFDMPIESETVAALVLAPIEQFSPLASQLQYATTFIPDVYGKAIQDDDGLIFQYQGHPWTICLFGRSSLPARIARTLSRQLQTKSIFFLYEDTGGWIDYRLFQDGIAIEELHCDSYVFGGLQRDGFVLSPQQLDDNDDWDIVLTLEEESLVWFRSSLRTVSAAELEREEIFHDLFLAQDAWMPDEDCIPFIDHQCTAKTLASSDFVRVDVLIRTYAQQVALSNASDVQGH